MNCDKTHKYKEVLNSTEYKLSLSEMAKRIVNNSQKAPNEATIESYFDSELFSFFREKFGLYGFEYNPIKEKTIVTRHTLKGRADTALSSMVIEFKQPSTLKNKKLKDAAIQQLCDYMESLCSQNAEICQGLVTDGVKGCFVQYCNKEFTIEKFYTIDGFTLDKLIRLIIQVELIALTGSNLVAKICNPPEYDGVGISIANTLFSS